MNSEKVASVIRIVSHQVAHFACVLLLAMLLAITLHGCGGGTTGSAGEADGGTGTDTNSGNQGEGDADGGAETGGGTDTDNGTEPDTGTETDNVSAAYNFLFIITDDQGLDASAQYSLSNDTPNTPVIDQLAGNGIVFDNMWATPSCTTTRGSLLTGMHGVNSGVDTTPSLMDTNILTVQRHLGNNGYTSAVFGKWHVAGNGQGNPLHPNESGVDHYAGNLAGTVDDYSSWDLTINGVQQSAGFYHTTAVTDMAIDWIRQQQGPWFTWVAYVAPHSPFHLPPAELHNRSLSGTAEDIDNNTRSYFLAAIEAMDTEIGRLLESLDDDQRANTVIMVIGDNGTPRAAIDTSAFPRTHAKNSLYEGGIRVPFVVSGDPIGAGSVREAALVNTVDIMPTLSELAGADIPPGIDGVSFASVLSVDGTSVTGSARQFNYSEFIGDMVTGWTVRDAEFKLIELADGTREFYDLRSVIREETNLIDQAQYATRTAQFDTFAAQIRGGESSTVPADGDGTDITGAILQNTSANCAGYAARYQSSVLDVNNNASFNGSLVFQVADGSCTFITNAIPNHDFNDGNNSFPNNVAEQNDQYTITVSPAFAAGNTPLSLTMDNAILLNGVKVDLLAAACFGVGNERTGCGDPDQPWRFDPMFSANGFRIDSHNAHTQSDGTYHYHGVPNALFESDQEVESPLVGFAADGFPIYGSYFNDGGTIRKARSGYRVKSDTRPDGDGNPGGTPDGTFRDDYEYVEGLGDLDECNGMTVNGVYGYYMVDEFPYVLNCFRGTPDSSFFK